MTAARTSSDLEIVSEVTIVDVARGRGARESLRVSLVHAVAGDGTPIEWTSVRIYWRDSAGASHPGRQGIAVRRHELRAVAEALLQVADGRAPTTPSPTPSSTTRAPSPTPQRPAGARVPEHRESSAGTPLQRALAIRMPPDNGADDEIF